MPGACLLACLLDVVMWLLAWSPRVFQNIEVNAVGIQPQHCIVLNTLDGVARELGSDDSPTPTGSKHAAVGRRLVVVIRPGRSAEVLVNGVRATEDTVLVHGDRCVGRASQ
jgi:hypothetical protein